MAESVYTIWLPRKHLIQHGLEMDRKRAKGP